MLWLVGDQFLPEDVLRVIGDAELKKTARGIICSKENAPDFSGRPLGAAEANSDE